MTDTTPPIADAMTDPTARDLIQRLADSVELLLLMRNGLTPLVITEAALDEARAYLASPLPAATDCPRINNGDHMPMDQQHPITPPPELVREWNEAAIGTHFPPYGYSEYIAAQAARWGADQELEACCEILRGEFNYHHIAEPLRAARRPKPPRTGAAAGAGGRQ